MLEDKLTQGQRIRLEALAQAVAYSSMRNESPELVCNTARVFERYIIANP